jgi:hypothetical protein
MFNTLKNLLGGAVAKPLADKPSFLPVYDQLYGPHLMGRTEGFRIMFERLDARARSRAEPMLIVETGSLRNPGHWADGQSTLLWKEFAGFHDCEIHSVDLDPAAAATVRKICGDAVAFLYEMAGAAQPRQIDLLYLDSYDFEPENPFPSAFHHVKELIAIRPCLRPGTIVAIDDNYTMPDGQFAGKGYLAMQWFRHLDIKCLYSGYQFIWEL